MNSCAHQMFGCEIDFDSIGLTCTFASLTIHEYAGCSIVFQRADNANPVSKLHD